MTSTLAPSASLAFELATHRATLHFGLRWMPLIGSQPAQLARKRAKAAQASHYIYCGERSVAFAVARLVRTARHWRHFSAAAIFAASHPTGAVLWMACLPDGRYWLVGARDGAVLIRTDRIYESWAHTQDAADQLLLDDPGLTLLPSADWPPDSASANAHTLETDHEASGLFARLMALSDRTAPMVPLSVLLRLKARWWLLALLASGIALTQFRNIVPDSDADMPRASEVDYSAPDHARARAAVIQENVQAHWGGANHYIAVLTALRALPVVLDGWRIARARCEWAFSAWACKADYRRERADATNLDLLKSVPHDRQVHFTPFSVGHVSWSVVAEPAPLEIENFLESTWVDAALVSALQLRTPAFVHMTLGPRVELEPGTSIYAAQPVSDAERAPPPGRRALLIEGPLRSVGVLDELAGHVAWDQVVLQFQQGAVPGLSQSALHIALRGWIHEK